MSEHNKDAQKLEQRIIPSLRRKFENRKDLDKTERVDATVLSRLLLQGPDPYFLMKTSPLAFSRACAKMYLSEEEGVDAIESAHWKGPGVLLDGDGLDFDIFKMTSEFVQRSLENLPLSHRKEALWLFMASCSTCIESGYPEDESYLSRIQIAINASKHFESELSHYPAVIALAYLSRMYRENEFTVSGGIRHYTDDIGFYLGYKSGDKVVGVIMPDRTIFYGTTPDTTLDEQRVNVDVKISETYGYVNG
jgi:hypothetical protein